MNDLRLIASLSFLAISVSAQDEKIPASVCDNLRPLYKQAAEMMKACSPFFKTNTTDSFQALTFKMWQAPGEPRAYEIWGDLIVKMRQDSLRVHAVLNRILFERLQDETDRQTVPVLDPAAAIERARRYCKVFEMEVPPDFKLTDVNFDKIHRSCWVICWTRFSGEFRWGDEVDSSDAVGVVFHERYCLQSIRSFGCWPPPKSLDVMVTREQAIAKAGKCVTLLQQTPFYRRCRSDGFVVKALKSCELTVVRPNWLLDAKRATLTREGPPKETRLCWVVQFTAVDGKSEERKDAQGRRYDLGSRDFTIYIDAATSEAVGASFN